MTIGTFGKFFLLDRPPELEIALIFVSSICSRKRITSSNDSLESILNTSTNKSPINKIKFLINYVEIIIMILEINKIIGN